MTELMVPHRVRFVHWLPRLVGHDAITIRRTIYTRLEPKDFDALLHAHEYCHVMQWRAYGVLGFPLCYLWNLVAHGYRSNRFELDAASFAAVHFREFESPYGTIV